MLSFWNTVLLIRILRHCLVRQLFLPPSWLIQFSLDLVLNTTVVYGSLAYLASSVINLSFFFVILIWILIHSFPFDEGINYSNFSSFIKIFLCWMNRVHYKHMGAGADRYGVGGCLNPQSYSPVGKYPKIAVSRQILIN